MSEFHGANINTVYIVKCLNHLKNNTRPTRRPRFCSHLRDPDHLLTPRMRIRCVVRGMWGWCWKWLVSFPALCQTIHCWVTTIAVRENVLDHILCCQFILFILTILVQLPWSFLGVHPCLDIGNDYLICFLLPTLACHVSYNCEPFTSGCWPTFTDNSFHSWVNVGFIVESGIHFRFTQVSCTPRLEEVLK